MTGKEILQQLNALLDSHAKLGGSIYQVGYKDDFFKLFIEAYRNDDFDVKAHPRLTGDAIRDYFNENIFIEKNDVNAKKIELLEGVLGMWMEWYYALDKVGVEL